jgi:hypothetical protein
MAAKAVAGGLACGANGKCTMVVLFYRKTARKPAPRAGWDESPLAALVISHWSIVISKKKHENCEKRTKD